MSTIDLPPIDALATTRTDADHVRDTCLTTTYETTTSNIDLVDNYIDSGMADTGMIPQTMYNPLESNHTTLESKLETATVRADERLYRVAQSSIDDLCTQFERTQSHLSQISAAQTTTGTSDAFTRYKATLEQFAVHLKDVIGHESYDECEQFTCWEPVDEATHDGQGITVNGYCMACGKEFDSVYDFTGVWDPDEDDYVFVE